MNFFEDLQYFSSVSDTDLLLIMSLSCSFWFCRLQLFHSDLVFLFFEGPSVTTGSSISRFSLTCRSFENMKPTELDSMFWLPMCFQGNSIFSLKMAAFTFLLIMSAFHVSSMQNFIDKGSNVAFFTVPRFFHFGLEIVISQWNNVYAWGRADNKAARKCLRYSESFSSNIYL